MAAHYFTTIPVLDISLAEKHTTRPQLLSDLRHALTNVGFLYVVNHGVSEAAIADIVDALPRLFALSAEEKQEVALHNSPHFLGYSSVGSETTAGKADSREQFEFATELEAPSPDTKPLYEGLRGPNQWPSAYPATRPIVETYLAELTSLGERFLRLVAEALSLPSEETLFSFLSDQHRLKLVRYPPSPLGSDPENLIQGVGPHKDSSGWWTFLLQASPPEVRGLQVLSGDGTWIDAPNIPGSFVVNIGQAFEVVTGGVCKATTHRVVMAPGAPERYSVPFFQGVRRSLTKREATETLKGHFKGLRGLHGERGQGEEEIEIDSPFLMGKYDTWGESQLRTKIRSHRDVGRKFYGGVFEKYVNDD
ncbi:oxidoreductase [Cercophora newfieldiana]|uniref:Oxidoreductase n=1 Tax=Cercophora newfieldiana TaxID=92897 RepID=A0AA39YH14_9PEZI|nr:oxidoreductase [Cercophora newfieldiana]